jgi:AmmeMemoRadiSam system protein B
LKFEPRRQPAVAGIFYPSDKDGLSESIHQAFLDLGVGPGKLPPKPRSEERIYGIVTPHAGIGYSGAVAANGFYEISPSNYKDIVMVGPNHYGIGSQVAIMKNGTWVTPLGIVDINSELASSIEKNSTLIKDDEFAHSRDHCLEVQIPFFLFIWKREFRMVPIVMISQDIETSVDVGRSIAKAISGSETLLVASSDFTHYESNVEAYRKDIKLVDSILGLDVENFYSILERERVSACGYGAIAAVMTAAKLCGATHGRLLRYATSGDVTGDKDAVVGYSSIIFA